MGEYLFIAPGKNSPRSIAIVDAGLMHWPPSFTVSPHYIIPRTSTGVGLYLLLQYTPMSSLLCKVSLCPCLHYTPTSLIYTYVPIPFMACVVYCPCRHCTPMSPFLTKSFMPVCLHFTPMSRVLCEASYLLLQCSNIPHLYCPCRHYTHAYVLMSTQEFEIVILIYYRTI